MDDAVYSLGMFIDKYKEEIIIVDVFTKANENNIYSKLIKEYTCEDIGCSTKKFSHKLILKWERMRKKENEKAFRQLNVNFTDWEFIDAMFRQKSGNYIYPTERALFGGINENDEWLQENIKQRIKRDLLSIPDAIVIFPMGIGNHADHVILNEVGKILFKDNPIAKIYFYQEFPYSIEINEKYVLKEKHIFSNKYLKNKISNIKTYKSQIKGNFGNHLLLKQKVNACFGGNEIGECLWMLK